MQRPVGEFLRFILDLPPGWVVSGVALLTAAESAVFLGAAVPGEVTAIVAGAIAAQGRVPLGAVMSAAIAGPWIGDNCGYWLGRRYGSRWARSRPKHRARWMRARAWLRRKGGFAVLLGRFTPFLRSVMPGAAGAFRMPYGRYLPSALASGALWGGFSTLAGYYGARNLPAVVHAIGGVGLALLCLVILLGILLGKRARARRPRR